MRILQIVPTIGHGTGVGGVAHHLEQEWQRRGVQVERFTLSEAGGAWIPEPGPGIAGKALLAARVIWFSTVGTVRARRRIADDPDMRVICHNDVLAGEVYVNHGILQEAMRARGSYIFRMVRNPMHLFIAARDRVRYRGGTHDAVVNLARAEDGALRMTFPGLRPRTTVIGNGVDVERYRPPAPEEREHGRVKLGLAVQDIAMVFVGHEYGRKGLPVAMDALRQLPEHVHLVVVGGTRDMVQEARHGAEDAGVASRLHLVGQVDDPRPWLHAGDVLVMPSAYESYGLVVLEALACGLPVVATPVGCVPDVIVDGEHGYVVDRNPTALAEAVEKVMELERAEPGRLRRATRALAEQNSWAAVADQYLELLAELRPEAR